MQKLMVLVTCAGLALSAGGCKKEKKTAATDQAAKTTDTPAPVTTEPEPAAPAKPPTAEEKVKVYQDAIAALNARDWDKLKSLYATDAEASHADSGMDPLKGRDEIVEKGAKVFLTAFEDAVVEPQIVLQNGDKIASITFLKGTHTKPLMSPMGEIPATNKKIGVYGFHMIEFVPGKLEIARETHVRDQGVFMGQLGLSKQPHRPAVDKGMMTEPVVLMAKDDEVEKGNVAAYKATSDLFNKHDVKALAATWADDVKFIEIAHPKDQNKKESMAGLVELFKGFPDIKWDATEVWGAGDYTVGVGHMTGTHSGNMKGMKKTGKPIDITGVEITRFDGGKVKENWLFFNSAAMAMQLGLMKPPGGGDAPPAGGDAKSAKGAKEPAKKDEGAATP